MGGEKRTSLSDAIGDEPTIKECREYVSHTIRSEAQGEAQRYARALLRRMEAEVEAELKEDFLPHSSGTHHITDTGLCLECTMILRRRQRSIEKEVIAAEREANAKLVEELRVDEQDADRLRERLVVLLRGVANGLKGPPPELLLWDWSDLPVLSDAYRALYEKALEASYAQSWRHAEKCTSQAADDRRPDGGLVGRHPCDCGLDAFFAARRAVAHLLFKRKP